MVHIHHSQPLKIKFGTNHFLGSETFGPIQYREGVNTSFLEPQKPDFTQKKATKGKDHDSPRSQSSKNFLFNFRQITQFSVIWQKNFFGL